MAFIDALIDFNGDIMTEERVRQRHSGIYRGALVAAAIACGGGIFLSCTSDGVATGDYLDFTPTNGTGTGGPQVGGEALISNFLVGKYNAGDNIEIDDVTAINSSGDAILVASFVIEGIMDDPDWTAMPVPEKLEYLGSIETRTLNHCQVQTCEFTIVIAAMRSDTGVAGELNGFEVLYSADGRQYKQDVDHIVQVCPPETPDCSADF